MPNPPRQTLSIRNHRRDATGMTYVYPVLSRRAAGISVGINLNPNNACNWRCVYCQVPGLRRGGPPPIDLAQLEAELRTLIDDIVRGNFMEDRVEEDMRRLSDIAFSGNGEPTSAREFSDAVGIAASVMRDYGLTDHVKLRLITNGSLIDRLPVRTGIERLGKANGELWFKLDAAKPAAIRRINGARLGPEAIVRRIRRCATLCSTWLQTCFFAMDDNSPAEDDVRAYLQLVESVAGDIAGVHLYGLARESCQPEAPRLGRLPDAWFEYVAEFLRDRGLNVKVSP